MGMLQLIPPLLVAGLPPVASITVEAGVVVEAKAEAVSAAVVDTGATATKYSGACTEPEGAAVPVVMLDGDNLDGQLVDVIIETDSGDPAAAAYGGSGGAANSNSSKGMTGCSDSTRSHLPDSGFSAGQAMPLEAVDLGQALHYVESCFKSSK